MPHHWSHVSETLALTAASWTAMMSVMMAPTVAPWAAAFHRFGLAQGENRTRFPATLSFLSGYFVVWALFGFVVALAQVAVVPSARSSGVILVGAGLFQFTSLKQTCLMHCRNPFSFLLARWQDGPLSAFHLGASHGAYCVGCCWALMMTSLAVGFMSLWWMAALAATTFVEQAIAWGARLRAPVGVALVAIGLYYFFFASSS
jgi:predicted metal-binding membrane protein